MVDYALGSDPWGVGPWGGETPADFVPVVPVLPVPGFAANDRYQFVVLSGAGSDAAEPTFRYWVCQPPEWASVLRSGDPEHLVKFYATDEDGAPVSGSLELPFTSMSTLDGGTGAAATVDGLLIEFNPRPTSIGAFDGGLDDDAIVGFTVYAEGTGAPELAIESPTPLRSGAVRSEIFEVSVPAAAIADDPYPSTMTAWVPCRLELPLRDVRAGFPTLTHVQIVSVEYFGVPMPSRHG